MKRIAVVLLCLIVLCSCAGGGGNDEVTMKILIEKSEFDSNLWVRFYPPLDNSPDLYDTAEGILESVGGVMGWGHSGSFPADQIDVVTEDFRLAGWIVEIGELT